MSRYFHSVLLALAMALPGVAEAQKHVVLMPSDGELPKKWNRPIRVSDASKAPATVRDQVRFLQVKGFLEASADTCFASKDTSTCPIVLGKQYRWARLSAAGVPVEIASEARFREKLYTGRPINPKQLQNLLRDLLQRSENSGHPFAKVWLDSLREEADGLNAVVRMEQGRLVHFDSVVVRGTAMTNPRYLQASIGIKPGDLYNEALVRNVERRIRELPFVTQKRRPFVQFTPENTKLFLFLDARKASSINGVLGIQPNATTGQISLTGDIDLRLRNALKRGEAIDLNWRSVQNSTQDLKIHGNLPFAFNTPFGIDGSLKLFKRDTSFLELTARIGLEYLLPQGDKLTLFLNSKSSDRLGSNALLQPGLADVNLLSYGLGIFQERFDYRFNPRSGHSVEMEGSTGRKTTSQAVFGQAEIPPEVSTIQYEALGKAVAHFPMGRRGTVRMVGQGGAMVNDDLYVNELYRIGGLRTMRGVDEASIYCSSYAIGTLEYRFVFEQNSNFFVFADQGWWENTAADEYVNDTPFSFGAGTIFETKAGLFSLTYALGKQFDIPIELQSGKVHFGFVSLF